MGVCGPQVCECMSEYVSVWLSECVWAAGRNDFGQLGAGDAMSSYVFVPVMSGHTLAMFAGEWHSMVVKRDGSVWAAGANLFGQLGDGSTLSKKTFVKVLSHYGATDAQGVYVYICAI